VRGPRRTRAGRRRVTWYVARAGGMLAYLLLSSSVVVGLLLSGKAHGKRWPRFALEDVHRFLGLLTGTFIVVHGGALLVDGYLPFSLSQLIVPGIAPYRPLAVSLGVVGRRAAPRARRHEPLPQEALVPVLAARALPQLRGLAPRARARADCGNRRADDLGTGAVRQLGLARARSDRAPRHAAPGRAGRAPLVVGGLDETSG
jgi:hypothetical protein